MRSPILRASGNHDCVCTICGELISKENYYLTYIRDHREINQICMKCTEEIYEEFELHKDR